MCNNRGEFVRVLLPGSLRTLHSRSMGVSAGGKYFRFLFAVNQVCEVGTPTMVRNRGPVKSSGLFTKKGRIINSFYK